MTACAIGIDLGGTQVRAALVDADGSVLARAAAKTAVDGGPEAVFRQIDGLVEVVSGGAEPPAAIGVCAPGPLDSRTGVVLEIPTLPGWRDVPLRSRMESAYRLPVVLENDGIAAAYGEWRFGAGRGHDHLVYVTVSTGIGGGVVADGSLLHGRRGMAAHVGHMRIVENGPRCSCGSLGCFEALASGTALGEAGRRAAAEHPGSLLATMGAGAPIDAAHIAAAARQGDAAALSVMQRHADYLGRGFTNLVHLFSPELVIMGGGVAQAFDCLSVGIHAALRRDALQPFKEIEVVPAALGTNSGLVGAAALAMHGLAAQRASVDGDDARD